MGRGAAAESSDEAAGTKPCNVRAKKSMNVEMPTRRIAALDRISLTPDLLKPTPSCRPFHPYHRKFGKSPPTVADRPPEIPETPSSWPGREKPQKKAGTPWGFATPEGQADRTIWSTSSAYRSSFAGPTPGTASNAAREPGFASAISASVLLSNTT